METSGWLVGLSDFLKHIKAMHLHAAPNLGSHPIASIQRATSSCSSSCVIYKFHMNATYCSLFLQTFFKHLKEARKNSFHFKVCEYCTSKYWALLFENNRFVWGLRYRKEFTNNDNPAPSFPLLLWKVFYPEIWCLSGRRKLQILESAIDKCHVYIRFNW